MNERVARQHSTVHNLLAVGGLMAVALTGSVGNLPAPASDTLAQRVHAGKVTEVAMLQAVQAAQAVPAIALVPAPAAAAVSPFKAPADSYYAQLGGKLRWLPVRLGDNVLRTPDAPSRLLLAQSAARRAGLEQVGLSYRDVYGIINAETSWIPRMGSSKDGTPNLGIAQFEPATAKAVGLTDPQDPVQAVHAAAMHLKEAAIWSARRLEKLKLTPEQHALKLREGVSIYYNLSVKGRNKWNGLNAAKLPVETQRHIQNTREGAEKASELADALLT